MNAILILLPLLMKLVSSQICEVCQNLVKEFHVGVKASDKGNFGGGNTAWEEERLGNFATSETRLIHILDGLCPSSVRNVDKCQYMREEFEERIEKWWFEIYRHENSADSLYKYLCVDHIGTCCLDKHYGKKCDRCAHYDESRDIVCSGRGQCNGNGTRDGNGTCSCESGYNGDACESCAGDYYESSAGTCDRCNEACVGCTGGGTSLCVTCRNGYHMVGDVCEDVDECNVSGEVCGGQGEMCVNSAGSYKCECTHTHKMTENGTCVAIDTPTKILEWVCVVAMLVLVAVLGLVTNGLDRTSVLLCLLVLALVSSYFLSHSTTTFVHSLVAQFR